MIVVPAVQPAPRPSEPLTASLTVAYTKAEKAEIRKRAAAAGLSMSAYVRRRSLIPEESR